ncbi:MAG: hypothetical protein AB7D47_13370 [Desulfovibrio sp.]|jgi:hypothetical protein
MSFADAALGLLLLSGREVVLRRADKGEGVLRALVTEYGFGDAPGNWPEVSASGMGRYAEFRLRPGDLKADSGLGEPHYQDVIVFGEGEYEIRAVRFEPCCFGEDGPLWCVVLAVSDQRGRA